MVNYLGYEAKIEEDVTKMVEIDIQGYKYICNYVNTHYNNNVKFAETEYECGKLINFSFDKVTNELLSFAIVRFPEDYVKKTKPITGEQAKQLADEFLKDYINFKKWTWIDNGYQGSISNTYRIKYEYIINNVITRRAYIEMDNCGNFTRFQTVPSCVLDEVTIPKLSDAEYIEAAKGLLKEIYKDKNLKDIKNCEIVLDKYLYYFREPDLDVISFSMNYTLVFNDGSEERIRRQILLCYTRLVLTEGLLPFCFLYKQTKKYRK
ncbi:MAG: YcdB/YcdC domain-containing protein [Eubacteriales bacterium]